jgi:hypothetical protein
VTALAQRQALAQAFADANPWLAGFTADPGTGLTGELTGGRAPITWGAPDVNARITGTATLPVPAGQAPTYLSACTAATGGRASDPKPVAGTPPAAPAQPTTATVTIVRQEL